MDVFELLLRREYHGHVLRFFAELVTQRFHFVVGWEPVSVRHAHVQQGNIPVMILGDDNGKTGAGSSLDRKSVV